MAEGELGTMGNPGVPNGNSWIPEAYEKAQQEKRDWKLNKWKEKEKELKD